MIQRVQTIFLLIVGLVMIAFLFVPIWQKADETTGASYVMTAFYLEKVPSANDQVSNDFNPYALIGVLAIISASMAFITISIYRKRMRQILLCTINALILGIILVLSAYWATQEEAQWLPGLNGQYSIGLFFPAIALVFNSLATRFIRKDEKLVRSMDRIR